MPQSLVKIPVHIVLSTKDHEDLVPPDIEPRLYGYFGGIITNNAAKMIAAGGVSNHIHLLVSIGRSNVPDLIGDIKRDSSSWMKQFVPNFYWQRGYGAFSVSLSHVEDVTGYIQNQKEHHKRISWEDEFRELCRWYEVEFDERYCWD